MVHSLGSWWQFWPLPSSPVCGSLFSEETASISHVWPDFAMSGSGQGQVEGISWNRAVLCYYSIWENNSPLKKTISYQEHWISGTVCSMLFQQLHSCNNHYVNQNQVTPSISPNSPSESCRYRSPLKWREPSSCSPGCCSRSCSPPSRWASWSRSSWWRSEVCIPGSCRPACSWRWWRPAGRDWVSPGLKLWELSD